MKHKKTNKASEILWAFIAIASLYAGVNKSIDHGISQSWYFFIFTLVAALMMYLKSRMRKNSE